MAVSDGGSSVQQSSNHRFIPDLKTRDRIVTFKHLPFLHLGNEWQRRGEEGVRTVSASDDDQPGAGVGVDHSRQTKSN